MLKITKMIKYLLLQFMNVADGDIYTKLLAATKISIAVSPFILVLDKLMMRKENKIRLKLYYT